MIDPTPAEALKARPYPDLLSDEEGRALLTRAEDLWADLQADNLGGFSGINRPFWILYKFKSVIEAFGRRDVGLSWSKDELDAALAQPPSPTFLAENAQNSLTAADAGEVRTYREGVFSEWQEIETAPKDGTDVLLFTDTRASDSVSMRIYLHTGGEHFTAVQIGFWEDAVDAPMRKERAGWRKDKIGEPTHWMPMPTPPAAAIRELP